MSSRDITIRISLGFLWFAESSGLVILLTFLGGPARLEGDTAFALPSVLLAASLLARFVLIPKCKSLLPLILTYIVGMAVCSGAGIYSLFHGGRCSTEAVVAALVCMLTYFPLFRLPSEEP